MNIREKVYTYKTKNEEGFTGAEEIALLKEIKEIFVDFNQGKYNDAMFGNTCMRIDDEIVTYHCDVVTALLCGIQHRDMYGYEFD